MSYHYIYLTHKVPQFIDYYYAMGTIEDFIYNHLDEFGCIPREDSIKEMIMERFGKEGRRRTLNLMIRLTDEQAVKTASDRSEYHHPSPVKIDKSAKKKLRKISKRKRSCSEEEPVHKKLKDSRCPICLDDMDTKKNITLDCNCVFHYTCIKKWLGVKKVCPTCECKIDV